MARRRRLKGSLTREQWRQKAKRDCAIGNHEWRAVNNNYAVEARCEHCGKISLTRNLRHREAECVREVARHLRTIKKRVEKLHPPRIFNKDGY